MDDRKIHNLSKPATAIILLCSLPVHTIAAPSCEGMAPTTLPVTINTARVLRQDVPATLFGFTLDWFQFQNGHFRNGGVRSETISWLKPFSGAIYRYSGGNAFEWKNAVGSIAERKPIYANYKGMVRPAFGPSEFFNLMQQVQGKAVILLNIVGPENKPSDQTTMTRDNLDYLSWLNTNGAHCVAGDLCPVSYFELGNEVDWESTKWSASDYSRRVLPLVTAAKSQFPGIKFAAMGKTSPWSRNYDFIGDDYDSEVAKNMGNYVDAVTIHPYYDGSAIPVMQSYIEKLAKKYRAYNPKINVLVTEHGRWPAVPKKGEWSTNWYQASGSGGALSTADFMLMLMNEDDVSGAMWHTISVTGPWQLFHLNKDNDAIYPSAVYWSLRTLRAGFLTDVIEVTPSLATGRAYVGGYDVRLAAMRNKEGAISLMGVNRSSQAKTITLKINGSSLKNTEAQFNLMQGDQAGNDNSDAQPNRFEMHTSITAYPSIDQTPFCIPPKSTFSIIVGAQSQGVLINTAPSK